MTKNLFLGIDVGHTNCKSLILSDSGEVLGSGSLGLTAISDISGQFEQSPIEIWSAVIKTVRDALAQANVSPDRIKAAAIGSYRGALAVADKKTGVASNFYTRLDSRDLSFVEDFRPFYERNNIYEITGQPCENYSMIKFMWLKNQQYAFPRGEDYILFLSPKEYLLYRMTGRHITNETMAQSSLMFNQNKGCYEDILLDYAGISTSSLPDVLDFRTSLGTIGEEFSRLTGLSPDTELVLGACDGFHSNIGVGAVASGRAVVSLGSFVAIRSMSAEKVTVGSASYDVKNMADLGWLLTIIRKNGGRLIGWCIDNFGKQESDTAKRLGISPFTYTDELIKKECAGWSGLLVLPNFNGSAMFDGKPTDPAVVLGLTYSTRFPHICKAMYEGISYGIRSFFEQLNAHCAVEEIFVGGGGAHSSVWIQTISDVLNKPVTVLREAEASAVGAAISAAVGSGHYTDILSACGAMVRKKATYTPNPELVPIYSQGYEKVKKLSASIHSIE